MAKETQSHGVQDTGNFTDEHIVWCTDEHIVWWTPPVKKKKAAARLMLLQLNISPQAFIPYISVKERNLKLLGENAFPKQISCGMIFKAEIKKTADKNSNLCGENSNRTQYTKEIGQMAPMQPTAQSQGVDKSLPPPSPAHVDDFRPTAPGWHSTTERFNSSQCRVEICNVDRQGGIPQLNGSIHPNAEWESVSLTDDLE
ncbi:hypothetical protein RHSIM_Rhsim08G0101900 [Rhododendron simsii]|uniref:Uncharacterized protein n=1 Tax=Rhododendron simsii TaxID=118357 RepID=A0A834GG32_RHOSS|nr:hypothetical protein RHSIM_Rhsim08G0101900 [Rhododendron simsii]